MSVDLTKQTIAIILAGGRGTRLHELTNKRSKPSIFFGGKFRVIDFVLSNCINSGIRRISVLTQYRAHSLMRHLQAGWNFLRPEANEFIDFLPAQHHSTEEWYSGTADAVAQNMEVLRSHKAKYVIILAGDHIYKMDYAGLLNMHRTIGSKCTVCCINVPLSEASRYGVMTVNSSGSIIQFDEKPKNPNPLPSNPNIALASMGIYVFDAQYLYEKLAEDRRDSKSTHDFGRDLIPKIVKLGEAHAQPFNSVCAKDNYWRDIGTIDSYWQANIDLTAVQPELNLYESDWPIFTYQEQLPPAKFIIDDPLTGRHGMALNSLVSGGCIVSGAEVRNSVLFSKCRINDGAKVNFSVLLPDVVVGENAVLNRVIIERGCVIPKGSVIGVDKVMDQKNNFRISEGGVVLVTREMLEANAKKNSIAGG